MHFILSRLPIIFFKPYADREALGQYWMKDLENGQFRNELYVAHISQLATPV